jgi:hypothetical protein
VKEDIIIFDCGLFEDMHGRHQDQGERLKIVQTRMQTEMRACIYTGLGASRDQSIKKSFKHPK